MLTSSDSRSRRSSSSRTGNDIRRVGTKGFDDLLTMQVGVRSNVHSMTDSKPIYWTLRVAAAACFIGHGAFGIITKAAWIPYFGVVGIPEAWAWKLMPIVGTVDIVAGLSVLFSPRPVVLLYM